MLERVYTHLVSAFGASNSGGDPAEKIDLARLSTQVVDDSPHVELLRELEELIDRTIADYLPVEATGTHQFSRAREGPRLAAHPRPHAGGRCGRRRAGDG